MDHLLESPEAPPGLQRSVRPAEAFPMHRRPRARHRTALAAALAACALTGSGCDALPDDLAALFQKTATSRDGVTTEGRARRLYYQFVDDRGRVHFVEQLEAVPAAWRGTMGYVEMDVPPPLSPLEARRARDARSGGTASKSAGGPRVVLYSADWCGACRKAKRYLDAEGVDYELRDVDDPEHLQTLVEKTGRKGIPVLDVDGRIITGFSPKTYASLL